MTKQFLSALACVLFLFSCNNTASKEDYKEDITKTDSISVEIEKAKDDIEKSAEELDVLLNDL